MKKTGIVSAIIIVVMLAFGVAVLTESSAWARAGGGSSSGSRGGRSFSAPSMPQSRPSTPGYSTPGSPGVGSPGFGSPSPYRSPSSGGWFSRSPFMQGLAGGLAGGFLGNLLFGGRGYAAPMGAPTGGGIGLMDILILGLLGYLAWRFFKKRRTAMQSASDYSYSDNAPYRDDRSSYGSSSYPDQPQYGGSFQQDAPPIGEVDRGFAHIGRYDPSFSEEGFKETVQDLFFRIQAGWMNRGLEGIEGLLTGEMAAFFSRELEKMKQQGRINRLENIAVRKVEPTEVWQESGKDFVTVLFTANLLDYTVDERTGQVVGGDKLSPVKFQEFWTFCRDIGAPQWKLSGINQLEDAMPQAAPRVH